MDDFGNTSVWRWNWIQFCGTDGFEIWSPNLRDFGQCFQKLCLQIPVLFLIAIISSYYAGRHFGYVIRGNFQKRFIKFRCVVVLTLAIIPIIQSYVDFSKTGIQLTPIKIFLAATECVAWFMHFLYLLALNKRLGLSPRGPVKICVIWTLYAVLTVISLHSNYLIFKNSDFNFSNELSLNISIITVVLQVLYALSLVPGEGNSERLVFTSRYVHVGEQQPLLSSQSSAYNRFLEDHDPYYLGVALEEDTIFSKLLFYWVTPLIKKGTDKKLKEPDDLYDLPVSLSVGTVSLKLQKALIGNVDKTIQSLSSQRQQNSVESSPEITFSNVETPKISLIYALHKCFWFQFYSIGILRFISDCSGFAGPLLLNKLVTFIENKNEDIKLGYLYAFGLFITTLIGALCNAHFNFYMSLVGLKIRAALVTTIYRKTLTVEATQLNSEFNVGEIINFMSTDTDRIVNSCPSFHAVWSIPFQVILTKITQIFYRK